MNSQTAIAILISGLPGTGKTYFAKRLAPFLGASYFGTDAMRKHIAPDRTYTHAEKASVYHEILERFQHSLRAAQTVVMDATFYKQDLRDEFVRAARDAHAKVMWIEVRASEDVIRERLSRPRPDSDADFAVYLKLKGEYEPIQEPHLVLDSTHTSVEVMIAHTQAWMKEHLSHE
jgi:predicted kinase